LPLNTAYLSTELAHVIADASPKLIVCRPDTRNAVVAMAADAAPTTSVMTLDAQGQGSLADAAAAHSPVHVTVARAGDDPAALLYTSGTTGRPKGALISHRAMTYCAGVLRQAWHFTQEDVLLHALPLFHGHGLFISTNVALAAGAKILFQRRFDVATVIAALPATTVFMAVPTYYSRLLAEASLDRAMCAQMRLFTSGSAPLSAEVHREFEARTGHRILERYGATETMILCANPLDGERRPGSVGQPLPGVALRIADADDAALPSGEIGMIEVRGPGLFSGYWNMPEQTALEFTADGYFRTGDLGSVDADGYLSITGRSKDLIISGGYNVYPAEVETTLNQHPDISESAVIGIPHADFGEAVIAIVIARAGSEPLQTVEVLAWAKARLANFKVPKRVIVAGELPRNAMGKVLKNELRRMHADLTYA
jgi:malonyl-CoA/methylmalonyl-CoA synthetase